MYLIDSNVILDILTQDPVWYEWSSSQIRSCLEQGALIINPIIYAEVAMGFLDQTNCDQAIPPSLFRRDPLPYQAGFLAAHAYLTYRRRGGIRTSPLPDFYIGAHASVANLCLVTRDKNRYQTYFPTLSLIIPD